MNKLPLLKCPNCDRPKPETDPFCSGCGQKHTPLNESVWHVISDTFVQMFSVDGRIFRTLKHLIMKPGFLSCEYRIGRRKKYIGPIQMFLISSVFFFFVIGMSVSVSDLDPTGDKEVARILKEERNRIAKENDSSDTKKELDREFSEKEDKIRVTLIDQSILITISELRSLKFMERSELLSFMKERGVDTDPLTVRLLLAGSVLFDKNGLQKLFEKTAEIGASFSLVFVPLFALLVRFFYPFKERRLLHTAVFSAYLHASVLLPGALMGLAQLPLILIFAIQGILFSVYCFLGLSRMYRQGWFFTGIKVFILLNIYLLLFIVATSFMAFFAAVSL